MPKDTREKVTLSPEAYKALEVEAMLHGTSLKDTASKLILKAACPKCIEILDIMARPARDTQEHSGTTIDLKNPSAQGHKGITAQVPKGQRAQVPKVTKTKGKKLSEDPTAISHIKELWGRTPRPSQNAIAKAIDYPPTTVKREIRRMIQTGELPAK